MIKAVIFDLNGVFLRSELLSVRFHKKFPQVSVDEFTAALKEVMAVARKPGVADAFQLWEPHLKSWGVFWTKDEFFNFWFSGEKVMSQIIKYSHRLRQSKIKVFILSNNFKERTQYYRRHFPQIFSSINGAYFSWETGFVKPDPQAFINLLEENGLNPTEVIFFDDQDKNIEVATDLKIVARKFQGLPELEKDLRELL